MTDIIAISYQYRMPKGYAETLIRALNWHPKTVSQITQKENNPQNIKDIEENNIEGKS